MLVYHIFHPLNHVASQMLYLNIYLRDFFIYFFLHFYLEWQIKPVPEILHIGRLAI